MLIAASVLLPVLFTVAVGFVLERLRPVEARTLATLSIYVLTPCLVFYSLLTTRLGRQDILATVMFLPLLTIAMWGVTRAFLWIRREPAPEEGPAMLCSLFMNAGNFGIPMCKSAFGQSGVEHGVVWVTVQNTLLFPLAVYYAARDSHGAVAAFREVFRLPVPYMVVLAGGMRLFGVTLPEAALEPIKSIGYAMIPVAQILLGVQLGKTAKEAKLADTERIKWVVALRLIASPLLAVPIAAALGAHGLTRNILIMLSGTPTAVNIAALSLEYNNRPHFVAAAVFFSTVLSFVTLSVLLSFFH